MALNNVAHFPLIALDAEINTVSRFKTGRLAVIPPHFKEQTSKRSKEGNIVSLYHTQYQLVRKVLMFAIEAFIHVSLHTLTNFCMLYTDPAMLFPCKSNLGKVVKKETLLYERVMTLVSASICAVSLILRQISLWLKDFLYHTQGTHQTDNYNSKFFSDF